MTDRQLHKLMEDFIHTRRLYCGSFHRWQCHLLLHQHCSRHLNSDKVVAQLKFAGISKTRLNLAGKTENQYLNSDKNRYKNRGKNRPASSRFSRVKLLEFGDTPSFCSPFPAGGGERQSAFWSCKHFIPSSKLSAPLIKPPGLSFSSTEPICVWIPFATIPK